MLAALDLRSKQWVFCTLAPDETRPILNNLVELRRSLNDGAVFGSFTGYVAVFIVASVFAVGFVVYMFARSGRGQWGLHVALAMVLSGAMGNLYDRAFIKADVVRFQSDSGQQRSFIGKLLNDPSDSLLRVGEWPDGRDERVFKRSEVVLSRQGVVRDFIKFVPKFPKGIPRFGGLDVWPWIFNVADASLVIGVALLLLHSWIGRAPRDASHTNAEAA